MRPTESAAVVPVAEEEEECVRRRDHAGAFKGDIWHKWAEMIILVNFQCGWLVCCHFSAKEHLWVCRDLMLKSLCAENHFCPRYDGHVGTERPKVGGIDSNTQMLMWNVCACAYFICPYLPFLHWAHTEGNRARRSLRIPQPHRTKLSLESSWRPIKTKGK